MTNHVRNILTVFGPACDVATFVMQSRTPRPQTGDEPLDKYGRPNLNYTGPEVTKARVFDFHGVVPLPDAYRSVPYSNHPFPGGYEMQRDAWGCKWGPYNMDPQRDIILSEHMASFAYTTAGGIPDRYYTEASRVFPTLTFAVSWGGEGPCWGRALYQGGACTMEEEGNNATLPDYGEEHTEAEDEAAYARYQAAINHYLTTHGAWVQALLEGKEV